jgi:signal transduction histidine kinase
MKLKNKMIFSFSITFAVVLGIALMAVYISMSQYREEEFAERLKEKTTTTIHLMFDFKQSDQDLLQALDERTINNLYDEKILIFDEGGKSIYTSIDDTAIRFPEEILKRLQAGEEEIFYREGEYDVFAHPIISKGKTYYAIGKAYDRFGKEKLVFLGYTLIGVFILALVLEMAIAIYLSKGITRPISNLTEEVNSIDINNLARITQPATNDEIALLATGFNNMLARVAQAYSYQKNIIQHISHELKTPIAVLISNLERAETELKEESVQHFLTFQKNGLMQMASIVNTLLEFSKYEASQEKLSTENIRLDELILSCFDSLQHLHPEAKFELSVNEQISDAEHLVCAGNERMLTIAFTNIIKNAIEYSADRTVNVEINRNDQSIIIEIQNSGRTISAEEEKNLFTYFFRGENSRGNKGIGLGLVMVSRIIKLHKGSIHYTINDDGMNCFTIAFPVLS